ncbi:MAG: hypothetical protein VKI83_02175 [Synechococcaceae cyanobacterium]|nr:hypothetical protein [Synechococcaceae cyanobacterium]
MARKAGQDFFLFLIGGALFAGGIVLFTNQVVVATPGLALPWARGWAGRGGWAPFGGFFNFGVGEGFGLLMVPLAIGVALLLADVQRRLGWLLVWAASAAVALVILQSLLFSFRPTTLWSLLSMVVMVAGGAGLMFRSLRDYDDEPLGRRRSSAREQAADAQRQVLELRQELEQLRSRLDDAPPH